jgi:hypothetical protein
MAIFLPFLLGAGGCGHASFDFLSNEANVESGGAGGSLSPVGSGGAPGTPSGGLPNFPEGGGDTGGGTLSGGGEGGGPPCAGPGCPDLSCCKDIDLSCGPFDAPCGYCSRPDQCPLGSTCDPLTDTCLPACDEHFECPNHLPLCDAPRGVCTQCYEDRHCKQDGMNCVQGFCFWCDGQCDQ